jgi:hypothetical protein
MSIRLTIASFAGLGTLASLMLTITAMPVQADGVRATNCILAGGSISCTSTWRRGVVNPHIIQVPQPTSEKDIQEQQRRDRQWEARCRPVIKPDQYGVGRYTYAERGCEFGMPN